MRSPHAPVLLAPGRIPLTYGRLYSHVDDVVQRLRALGVGCKDRVALALPTGPEMAVAFLAVAVGATCAPLNPASSTNELDLYLADVDAKALIVAAGTDTPARAVAHLRGIKTIELSPVLEAEAGLFTLIGEEHPCAGRQDFTQPDDVALVLPTSGTTSRPKIVPLTHTNICTAAHNMRVTLDLNESDRCLNVLPFFHVHALLTALLTSLVAGASCVCNSGFSTAAFFASMAEFWPTWFTAVPTIHQAILASAARHREIIEDCPLRFIRSASAPLAGHVLADLERVFKAPVLETYGMTETAAQITSNPLPPRSRKPGSAGLAAGPEVAIMRQDGVLLPPREIGEIVVRGPTVFKGYENDPAANSTAFTDGWFRTGDQGFLADDGYLFITGRLREIINRGGEKIAPQEVDNVLMGHPAVAQAVTFAVPHARLGEDLAAAVVLHQSATATGHDIRLFAATRLAAFKVPQQVYIVEDLPKSPIGKLQRLGLAERLGLTAPGPAQFTFRSDVSSVCTPLEELLAGICAQVLDVEYVGVHDDFFQLGGDSILATQLISRIRETLHVELSLHSFFETSTVAGIAKRIEAARQDMPSLKVPPLQPKPKHGPLPLSYAQQRLWFLDQLEPGGAVYNLSIAFQLTGVLDVTALEKSLDDIVQRHEILRTVFPAKDGRPIQVVVPGMPVTLPIVDLRAIPYAIREAEVQRRVAAESRQTFDLAQGPLWNGKLLRLADEEHVFLLNMHHIVFDGWSFDVFFKELTALYTAFSTGEPPPLPTLALQYGDFALWQRTWLQGAKLEAELAYWKKQLGGNLSPLELPTDRPRPPLQSFRGARQSLVIPQRLTQGLKTLSQEAGVTLFMTLLAAFKTLLYRYTGQEDLLIGAPIAGRTRVETEALIGFFVNTLILRTNMGGNPPFWELLGRVREVALDAYDHQHLPFEKLVDELQVERSSSHAPLVQVMFALQNAPRPTLRLPGLTLEQIDVDTGTAKFDLTLSVRETEQGLKGTLEYATDLFHPTTISRMLGHFHTLLEGIVAHPEHRLTDLPLLTEAERHQLLVEWNDTTTDYPQDTCLHEHFETWAERTPDTVAIICNEQQLTYRALNRQANQLAHYLRALGVGPEVCVGLCVERSLDMVMGFLGILKAGGTYVPLDPTHPKERLSFMLSDTRAAVLVTQQKLVADLPEVASHPICLDTDWESIAQQSEENPVSAVTSENLAYVMYTSGSTGKPKGVMVEHRQVLAFLHGFEHVTPSGEGCIGTAVCPFGFDVSVWECCSMLCFGGTLHIIVPDILTDPQQFVRYLMDHRITNAYIPHALLSEVASHLEKLPAQMTLNRLLVGTEPIKQGLLQRYRNLSKNMRIVNGYGPTESTVCATLFPFCSATEPERRTPIGTGIRGYEVYVLDANMQLVPIGSPGELHVGGVGLVRGYLNRPELNAEKFIPHPFRARSGARLYKTGDLVRRLPDGNLEFLGRLDQQVKIRGFRVEPGEIEAALAGLPVVQESVVVARQEPAGDKRLVAYVVPKANSRGLLSHKEAQASEHVSNWQALFEEIYGQASAHQDLTFNISGWNSSYTGRPIPAEEMREWVDHTVERLLGLRPNRVLEIGCGTGLLLSRIAPHCSEYWGSDFSSEALRHLEHVKRLRKELAHVTLVCTEADNFDGVDAGVFDTVILNSLVQYFPSVDYLLRVLESAVHKVRSGGYIFVGDVRSLPLLKAYHASVQHCQAPSWLPHGHLQQRVQQRLAQEEELVIDPAFFIALKLHFPQISHVQVQPKRGRHRNELTKFRYDVILHVGTDSCVVVEPPWLEWRSDELTLAKVYRLLAETKPEIIGLRHAPNARVQAEISILNWLASAARTETVSHLREVAANLQQGGIDPEELWDLGSILPYSVEISWSTGSVDGSYDVVFRHRPTLGLEKSTTVVSAFAEPVHTKPWSAYANDPLQERLTQNLVPYLRRALKQKLPDYMVPSTFMVLETVPADPNGKVNRQALPRPDEVMCRSAGTFVAPRTPTECILAGIWAEVLGLERIGIHDNFFELGGDSIRSIQIITRANQAGLRLTPKQLFQQQTIAELATVTWITTAIQVEQGLVTGAVPLTPIQHWFFEQEFPDPHHWNQTMLLEVRQSLDISVMEKAIQHMLVHHDMLRARFRRKADGWQQEIAYPELSSLCVCADLSAFSEAQQGMRMAEAAAQLQASLNLAHGPLVRLALFDCGPYKPARLLVIIHHLVVDNVSWQIVLEDLQLAYHQLSAGKRLQLPRKTSSFKHWAERLTAYSQLAEVRQELTYWLTAPRGEASRLPVDYPGGTNTVTWARTVSVSLSGKETDVLLQEVPKAYQTQLNDVLLTALVQAFARWTGKHTLLIDLEGHGREEIVEGVDLARTVGRFTTIFPVLLQLEPTATPTETLKSMKEQLRRIPKRGIGYGVLRYLGRDPKVTEKLRALPQAEVFFNYMGPVDQVSSTLELFRPSKEGSGPYRNPRGHRRYLLEVNGRLAGGQLQCDWIYSERIHRQDTIEGLARGFIESVRMLIGHCQSAEAGGYTPSDFPQMKLSQRELDGLLTALGESAKGD
ncbi:MAG TPA: amino acid adenylation domain-containing protein [Candidatus Tectomicrobia bacterium]|nr:amino acid adenylation domain-containing protein [Candidatus Tectomicrobia bacterium]